MVVIICSWIYNYLCNQCSKPTHGEVNLIQHYVIKLPSDLGQVGDFPWVLWFHPPIKLITAIYLKYC